MTRTTKGNARLDAELLELAQTSRGTLISKDTADKITMRILGERASATKPLPLQPDEIRQLREASNMSQAVFARVLNVTTGYVSQLERGVKTPAGPALALLHVIRRKGVAGVM